MWDCVKLYHFINYYTNQASHCYNYNFFNPIPTPHCVHIAQSSNKIILLLGCMRLLNIFYKLFAIGCS